MQPSMTVKHLVICDSWHTYTYIYMYIFLQTYLIQSDLDVTDLDHTMTGDFVTNAGIN